MLQSPPPNKGFKRALVAVHRTPTDATLLAYTAMLAGRGMIQDLRFVHVLPAPDSNTVGHERDPVLAEMKALVDRHFTGDRSRLQFHFEVLQGPLLDKLLEYAAEQQVDLILVGNRKDQPLKRSVARRLAMNSPCSVWLTPETASVALNRILVPIDFSSRSADALVLACALAAQAGIGEIEALHVYFDVSRTTYENADAVVRGEEQETFRSFLAPLNTFGVRVSPLFESGSHPADAIVRVAAERGADLIVLNSRGRSASAAILLGSVAEETLIQSALPVLTVKHFGARMGVLQALLDRTFHGQSYIQFD